MMPLSMRRVICKITQKELKMLQIIKFSAEWCAPCKMLGPIFDLLSKEESDNKNVEFKKVDVDNDIGYSQVYRVVSIPTIVFVKDGVEVDRLVGLVSKEIIINKIKEHQ